ncbi:hypothetical protein RIF25_06665 [Thermosynechococcaceae cyanobacterium BACA0444]|uniref:Uncharacterized protein n=1 Tax=Pseudocalidococcus azoricus BACA0444 TaxID=2918990 RepID=A0AAE4JY07_9CYAN|nr:hypothetical protein [Pseudocalidococcus azoricus]MDS3860489.1 hypothetical protein [Pseudocalidococcus azoricus BACA0444]
MSEVWSWLAWLQPLLTPLCFLVAWSFLGLLAWNAWQFWQEGMLVAKRMHQIPCSQCRFFCADYRLKCALHPHQAATESAIYCVDFQK